MRHGGRGRGVRGREVEEPWSERKWSERAAHLSVRERRLLLPLSEIRYYSTTGRPSSLKNHERIHCTLNGCRPLLPSVLPDRKVSIADFKTVKNTGDTVQI